MARLLPEEEFQCEQRVKDTFNFDVIHCVQNPRIIHYNPNPRSFFKISLDSKRARSTFRGVVRALNDFLNKGIGNRGGILNVASPWSVTEEFSRSRHAVYHSAPLLFDARRDVVADDCAVTIDSRKVCRRLRRDF